MSSRFPTEALALAAATAAGAVEAKTLRSGLSRTWATLGVGGWAGRWTVRVYSHDGGGMPRYREFHGCTA